MDELTHDELTRLLSYDEETGVFTWNVNRASYKAGWRAGSKNDYGFMIRVNRKYYSSRRLAYFYVNKSWPVGKLYAINSDSFDDRIKNIGVTPESNSSITKDLLEEIFNYDRESGEFKWKVRLSPTGNIGENAFSDDGSSCRTNLFRKSYRTSHLVWMILYSEFPVGRVCFVNNMHNDFRKKNLFIGGMSECNRKKITTSSSGFKGATYIRGRWQAQITIDGRNVHLGSFETPEEAHEAYMTEARSRFGDIANDGYQHTVFCEHEGMPVNDDF